MCSRVTRTGKSKVSGEQDVAAKRLKYAEKVRKEARTTRDFVATNLPKRNAKGQELKSNVTDNDSAKIGGPRGAIQGYAAQAAVDGKHQVIVAEDVTQETNDKQQAVPMLEQVKENTGRKPEQALMDAGYYSQDNIEKGVKLAGELFIPPNRQKHGEQAPEAPRGRIPGSLSVADRMRRKLRTERGRDVYAKRKEIVEPVFGQIKQGRGFRQFLLRGLRKVKGEWSLICTTHNLLKLWRAAGMAVGRPPGKRSWAFSG